MRVGARTGFEDMLAFRDVHAPGAENFTPLHFYRLASGQFEAVGVHPGKGIPTKTQTPPAAGKSAASEHTWHRESLRHALEKLAYLSPPPAGTSSRFSASAAATDDDEQDPAH